MVAVEVQSHPFPPNHGPKGMFAHVIIDQETWKLALRLIGKDIAVQTEARYE